MATTLEELLVRLGVSSAGLTAGLAKAEAEIKGFGDSTSKSGAKAAGGFNVVGMASLAIAGGVAAIGVESVKSASQFQSSMELIQTQAGASTAEVAAMTQGVLALAPAVGSGPDALAQGLYHIESAGIRGAQALDILKVAAEGAKVGHADLESVTNALVAANQSGVAGITSMSQAMGTLNGIVGAGNMRMQDLVDAMGTGILSSAKNFGVSIQSVGAALASMTDQGIPAVDAATRINSAMRLMAAPTAAAVKELGKIGLTSTSLAKDLRSPGGILTAITDLKAHLVASGMSAVDQAALLSKAFGGKQSGGILTLIGNVDLLKKKTDAVTAGAAGFGDAWAATEATAAAQGEMLSASMDTISTAIGTGLLPAVNQLLGFITPIITGMAQWTAANPGLSSTILAVVGGVAALTAGLIFLQSSIAASIGAALVTLAPFVLVIGLIAAAMMNVQTHIKPLDDLFATLRYWVASIVPPVRQLIGAFLDLARGTGSLGAVGDAIGGVIGSLGFVGGQIAGNLGRWGQAFVAWIAPMIPPVLVALGKFAGKVIAWIGQQLPVWTKQLLAWGRAFVNWIAPMIPLALAALGDLVGRIFDWIGSQVPGWVDQLGQWAQTFVDWVGPMIPPAIAALGDLAGRIFGWIGQQAPGWVNQLGQWAQAFIDWIAPLIPPLIGKLGDLAAQLVAWIVQQAPVIVAQVLKWVDAFITWVAPLVQTILAKIPDVLAALGQLGVAVVGWIAREAPKVAGAMAQIAVEFVSWVLPKIPDLLVALVQFNAALIGWMVQEIPVIVAQTFKWGVELGQWIARSIPGLMLNLYLWSVRVLTWMIGLVPQIRDAAINMGKAVAVGFAVGVGNLATAIIAQLNKIPGFTLATGAIGTGVGVANDLNPVNIGRGITKMLGFATGGVVPGVGPQLAVVHGGETVLPPDVLTNTASPAQVSVGMAGVSGGGGLAASLDRFVAALDRAVAAGVPLHIDGQAVGDMLDKRLSTSQRVYTTLAPSTGSSR